MFGIFQSYYGVPVVFIRYNPDNFKVNTKLVKIPERKRQDVLIAWIKKIVKDKDQDQHMLLGCNVKYLFYDDYDEGDCSFTKINECDVL